MLSSLFIVLSPASMYALAFQPDLALLGSRHGERVRAGFWDTAPFMVARDGVGGPSAWSGSLQVEVRQKNFAPESFIKLREFSFKQST